MTLDEAIKHAEEVAEKQEKIAIYTPIEMLNSDVDIEKCQECANEHRQLAEWLKDYKRMKEQEPTTKNDLGVDWESYKDADGNCLDDLILEVLQNNFDCGNTYGYKVADEIIELLPSVTPQEPQSFKWCTDCKEYDQEKHCCHRWSKVIRDTVREMKQEQEPCNKCEVGNPCLYCKHEFEPQESENKE